MSIRMVSSLITGEVKSGKVPVEHLDYEFIQKCSDEKYLEKILRVLRSGVEGLYPDLVEFCEKHIAELNPNSRALREDEPPATGASFSAKEWNQITEDLAIWEREVRTHEEQLSQTASFADVKMPPVRNSNASIPLTQKKFDQGKSACKENVLPRDYREWDKFDIVKECAKMDDEITEQNSPAAINQPMPIIRENDTAVLTDTERAALANRENEKGNEAFGANDFEEAVECYTRSLLVMPTAEVYNNRAEARIKLQQWHSAILDSEKALELEPGNVKVVTDTERAALANREKEKGNEAFRGNDFEEAVTYYTRSLLVMPTAEVYNNRAEARIKLQQWHSAILDSEKALELEPGNVKVVTDTERAALANREKEKGNEAFRGNDFEEAVTYYTRSLSVMPTAAVYNNRAQARIKLQQWHSALDDCEKALELEPGNVKALLRRATAQKELGNLKMAANDLRNVLQVEPQNEIAKKLLEDIERKEAVISPGDKRKFTRILIEEVRDDDDEVLTDTERGALANREKEKGNEAFRANDFEEAVECYTRSLSVMPTAAVYNNRAQARIKLQQWQRALDDCEKALELEPGNVKALLRRATAQKELGNLKMAANDLRNVLQVEPQNEIAKKLLEDIERKEVVISPGDKRKFTRILIKEVKDDDDEVLTDTERAALANREKEKGNEAFRANDFEEAVECYTRSLSVMPTAVVYNNRAQARIKLQDWHSALDDCEKALELEPGNVKALLRRATAQKELGNLEMAANDLRNVLQMEPQNEIAKKLLEDTEKKEAVISPGDQRKFTGMLRQEVKDDDDEVLTDIERAALANREKEKGNEAFRANDFEEAVECYTRSLLVMPTAEVYNNRADARIKLQDCHNAILDSEKALELEPGNVKVLTVTERAALSNREKEKGNEAFRANDFEEAVECYTRSLSVMPTAAVYNNRAQARIKLQQWHSALDDCEKALELEPGNVKALLRRATAQKELGNLEMAANDLRNVLQVEPQNEIAKKLLEDIGRKESVISPGDQRKFTRIHIEEVRDDDDQVLTDTERAALANREKEKGNEAFRANDFEEAVECYTRSLSVMPTAAVYNNRAQARIKLQDWHSALDDCEKALELEPGNVKALLRRATAQKELGNLKTAANDLRTVLQAEPQNEIAKPSSPVRLSKPLEDIERKETVISSGDPRNVTRMAVEEVKDDNDQVLTDTERAALANREKEKGNEAFRANDFEEAVECYTRSLSVMPTVAVYNNRAQARIKLQQWHSALDDCEKALELEPGNVKALLRRATAQKELGNLEMAANDLRNVLQMEPQNEIAKKLLEDTEKKEAVISPGDQRKFTGMLRQEVKDDDDEVLTDIERAALANREKEKGNEAFRANDFEEAVECYTRSLLVMPTAEVYNNRADARIKLQDCHNAILDSEKALELEPGNVKVLTVTERAALSNREKEKGNEAFRANDFEEAVECYTRSLSVMPTAAVYNNRAQARIKLQQWHSALDDCEKALELEPGNVKALLRRATAQKELGNLEMAANDLRNVLQVEPQNEIAKKLLEDIGRKESVISPGDQRKFTRIHIEEVRDDDDQVLTDTERAALANREKEKGNEAFRANDFEEAVECYTRSLSVMPTAAVYNNRAQARIKLQDWHSALDDCEKALELEPGNVKALLRRATAQKELGNLKTAANDLRTVLQAEPQNEIAKPSSPVRLSKPLEDIERKETVISSGDPRNVTRMAVEEVKDDNDQVLTDTERAALANREKEKGNEAFRANDFEEAVECYTRSLSVMPTAVVYNNRAQARIKLQQWHSALDDCEKALELEPGNVKALLRRATAQKELGNLEMAANDLRNVLQMEPQNEIAKKLLEDTEKKEAVISPGDQRKFTGMLRQEVKDDDDEVLTDTERAALANREKEKGNEAFRANDFEEAVECYTRSLLVMPTAEVYNNRADARIKLQDCHNAILDSEKALELEPGNVKVLTVTERAALSNREKEKGNEAFRANDFEEAVECYTRSLSVMPTAAVYNNRAQARIKLQQWHSALDDCEKALELEPGNVKALLRRATAQKELGNLEMAANDLRNVLQVEPQNEIAKKLLEDIGRKESVISPGDQRKFTRIHIEEVRDDDDQVLTDTERAALANREKEKGNEAFRANDFEEAVECYTRSLSVMPTAAVYNNRAQARIKLQDWHSALDDCEKALELEPGNVKALLRRATAQKELGNLKTAANDLRTVLQAEPQNEIAKPSSPVRLSKPLEDIERKETVISSGDPRNVTRMAVEEVKDDNDQVLTDTERAALANREKEKGNEAFRENDFEEAVECYTRSLLVMPTAEVYNNRADARIKLQDCHNAILDSEKALELEPGNVKVLTVTERAALSNREKEKGNKAFRANDFEEAVAYYTRSLSLMTTAVVYNNRAQARIKLQQWHSALGDCEKVLKLEPADVKALLRRATAQKELGNLKTAANHLKNVQQAEPQNEIAKKLLEDTEKKETVISPGDQRKFTRMLREEVKDDDDEVLTDTERAALANREKEKGNEAFRANDFEEAVEYYTRSLSVMPTAAVYNNRAQARIKLQQWHSALGDCEKVLKLEPADVKALLRRATAQKELGNLEMAANDLRNVLQAEPHNEIAKKLLEDTEKKETVISPGDQRKFTGMLRQEVKDDDDEGAPAEPRQRVGEQSVAAQNAHKKPPSRGGGGPAAKHAHHGPRRGKKGGSGKHRAPEPLKKDQANGAQTADGSAGAQPSGNQSAGSGGADDIRLDAPAGAPPLPLTLLKKEGNLLFKNGQFADALEKYSQAIAGWSELGLESPEDLSILYSNRAACHLKDGNSADCIQDCNRALELHPFSLKPLLRRAKAHESLGRYRKAYADYKTVLQIDIGVQSAQDSVNRITKLLIEQDGPDWREKIPEVPLVPLSAQHHRGEEPPSEELAGFGAARAAQETARRAEAQFASRKQEGNDCVKRGQHQEAVEKYSECLKLKPEECAIYTNRALCYLKLELFNEAKQDCDSALQLEPSNKKAFYRRALAYKGLKEYLACRSDLQEVLHLDPDVQKAERELQEVTALLRQSLDAEASPGTPSRSLPITEVDGEEDGTDAADGTGAGGEDGHHPEGKHGDGEDLRILLQPTNAFEFGQALNVVLSCGNNAACAKLLQAVAPETLPKYFGNKLDGHTIQFIMQALDEHLLQKDPNLVYRYLSHLHTADRFSMVLMLLDKNERRQITQLFEHLSAAETGEFFAEDVQNLANKYI